MPELHDDLYSVLPRPLAIELLNRLLPGVGWDHAVDPGYLRARGLSAYRIGESTVAEALAADHNLCTVVGVSALRDSDFRGKILRSDGPLVVSLMEGCTQEFCEALMRASSDAAEEQYAWKIDLLAWAKREHSIPGLRTASDVAEGLSAGLATAEYHKLEASSRRTRDLPPDVNDLSCDTARVVASAVACQHLNRRGLGVAGLGIRRHFHEIVQRHPSAWVEALEWLLLILDPRSEEIVDGTIIALGQSQDVAAALIEATRHSIPEISVRARGVLTAADGWDEVAPVSLSSLARRSDRGRTQFPRPLGEPTSTWLSDLEIEVMMHAAVADACVAFADEFRDFGSHEEEGHLRILMKQIEETLRQRQRASAGAERLPVDIVGAYRPIQKKEEKEIGADLAIVVSIAIPGQLELEFAEFVQVKKALNIPSGAVADRWRIKIDQIKDLLSTSPTAAYWLIGADGDVYAVPAKLLLGRAAGAGRLDKVDFTLHYTDIRHAAIRLESYLTYLSVGTWTGSAAMEAVRLGRSRKDAVGTRARAIFELSVRTGEGQGEGNVLPSQS
ncbi:hypothetical protein [Nocardia asteroides]|uniref:hypothetical protein n=1 Tax=Nocardia asteroides TaxID=1824 RepID=UPI001E38CB37|nr:hypothetical protein [Nocardia asteroides]UGT61782.1 hypothetical protein LTT61_00005 [Nocardia asteroides]